jgi:SAM-dependent methyltransferase
VRGKFGALGIQIDLRVGTNQHLPFENANFDFLVSWNVLHYEGTEEGVRAGLREYARVLKPAGRLILSTTGPEHKILNDARALGGHRYQIGREDDFRKGEVHFLFDASNYIHRYFEESFSDVLVGRTHDQLFTASLDWWIVTAVKL